MFSLGVFCCWLPLAFLDATNACFSLIFPSLLQDYSRLFVGYGGRVSNVNHLRLVDTRFAPTKFSFHGTDLRTFFSHLAV